MTGYGKGQGSTSDRTITVEIRSLNGKQLDMTVKSPSIYRCAEYEIRGLVSKALQRGKADVYIAYENRGECAVSAVNREMFEAYYRQLCGIGAEHGAEWGGEALAAAILRMPDVVRTADAQISDEELDALKQAVCEALTQLDGFRTQEGRVLSDDLLHRVDEIERLMSCVEPYEAPRIELVKNRIRENIESIGVTVDPNRLEQEMIFYVEKLDITEEKVRLANHLSYFREVADGEEYAGRKLGFIAQEMGREINTMGSKANDASIQQLVVRMKDELEKIKEQILNVL